jgi:hypothetical protein
MIRLLFAHNREQRYPAAMVFAVILFIVLTALAGVALAQGNPPAKVKIGDTVTGTLDAKSFAQTFALDGKAGDTLTLTATTKSAGLSLAMLLIGPSGNILSQTTTPGTTATIKDVQLPGDGQYLITVLRGTGAQGTAKGDFSLAITGSATQSAANLISLPQGLTVTLNWNTADDMNLEVRDPIGGDVTFRNPTVPSGGRLINNVNADCGTATADNPTETISWPSGNVPAGSYEIIAYFIKTCQPTSSATAAPTAATSSSVTGALPFAIIVTVNGTALEPVRSTLNVNQQYVASFLLEAADKVTLNQGGINQQVDVTPFASKIAAPTALNNRTSVTGTIDHNNPADAWSFTITGGTRNVSINMDANSGSLDPFLVLLGPNGSTISTNDDANDTTRGAALVNQALGNGTYTIVATRFALAIGGTEGNYTLSIANGRGTTTVSNPTAVPAATAAQTTSATLPTGSIEVTLIWNSHADLRLLIRDPAGRSVFSDNRQPESSGILERLGNFKCANTTTTPLTYAYWPTNELVTGTYEVGVWLQDRCGDTTVLPTYTLTVKVRNQPQPVINIQDRPEPNGKHLLTTFTIDQSGNATQGPAGIVTSTFKDQGTFPDLATATALSFGTPVTGTIDNSKPFDVYTFQAKAGDHIAIAERQTSGTLDTHLFVFDSNGNQIAENDDISNKDSNSRVEIAKMKADGTYVVIASRYGVKLGGTQGSYELTIAQLNK